MPQPGTTPLEPSQIEQLRAGLAKLHEYDRGRLVVETFLYTGIHPRALSHPATWQLRVQTDGQLTWKRPKTNRPVFVPIPPEIRGRISWLINELNRTPTHPTNLNQLVHRTCARFGMSSVTPRGLRHTFGFMAWKKFRDLRLVADWLSCSLTTATMYANADLTAEKEQVIRSGWGPGPGSPPETSRGSAAP